MRKLITSLALVLSALSSYAITPLWMRDARISPDGSEIVFCYKGDIYKVPAQYNRQIKKFPTEKQNVSLKHILT